VAHLERSAKMKLAARIAEWQRSSKEDVAKDALASLVFAAREDAAFRKRVLLVLNLPARDRESLVRTAVEEMERFGEPAALRAAFLALATPEGAEVAAKAMEVAE
jgi:hypothetical protein